MNLPLKILLVERRQADGCLKRALRGDFALKFQWRRVSSETELRVVAREYGATVVFCADDMHGRSQEAIAQMLCMLSPHPPQVMICEIGDGGAPWLCADADSATSAAEPPHYWQPSAAQSAAAQPTAVQPVAIQPAKPELPHILQNSPDAVVMLDADGWISEINHHARRLLGAGARAKVQLHVNDLIRSLQGAGEGEGMALPLVAVNLDGLLSLNAVHGMHYGNAVLELIAGVVQPQFARCGLLARLAANQYVAVFPHLSPAADAAMAVSSRRHLGADGDLTVVYGEATANDADISQVPSIEVPASSIDAILAADETIQVPTPSQLCGRSAATEAAPPALPAPLTSVEPDLDDAIQRRALSVHFQPQYDLQSGRGCGVEALARWTLADGRTLAPQLFIPIAERNGTIGALDAWILEKACATVAAWRGRDAERLTLSVNVSNRQIGRAFSRTLASALERTRLPAWRLELEIEELPILSNNPSIIECLRQWKQLGVRIAVNHRSSNYSNLAYLSSVAVDRLKLDKSLIHSMTQHRGTAAMVQATIALGAELGVDVIAEGVETHAQLTMLKNLGCRHAQGYLLARPMPAVEAQIALRKIWGNLPAVARLASRPDVAHSLAAH
jgi:EAL domain-containing protein (putative c-di-GMP-specific phosphodiesterase class I)/PAS domain-containing protein